VQPLRGVALVTEFTLKSTLWDDPDGDGARLIHTFSHVSSAGSTIGLGDSTEGINASSRAILSAGNITLRVTVTDPYGGATSATAYVAVAQSSARVVAAVQNMTGAVSALIAGGDGEAALGLLATGAESLSGDEAVARGDDSSTLTSLRGTLLSLAWNASHNVEETASTVALRAATLQLILSVPSQVRQFCDDKIIEVKRTKYVIKLTLNILNRYAFERAQVSATTASSAVRFAESVANSSRALRSISDDTRASLVSALSSTVDAGFLGSRTNRRRLSTTKTPATEIQSILSTVHLLTLGQLYPGEDPVTTSARALALKSTQAQCALGKCQGVHVSSPSLLGEEEDRVDASFILSDSTLAEISALDSRCKGSVSEEALGLQTIRWKWDPHHSQTADGATSVTHNVSSFTVARCGGEVVVQNLSSPFRTMLPAVMPRTDSTAADEESITFSSCYRAGDRAIVRCEADNSSSSHHALCLDTLLWNVSCGTKVAVPQCLWYDDPSRSWRSDGCRPVNISTNGPTFVECECNHATDFSGSVVTRAAQGFGIVMVVQNVNTDQLRKNWAILLLIVGSYVLAGLLFWSDWRRLKMRSQLEKQSIYMMPNYQASMEWLTSFSPSPARRNMQSRRSVIMPGRPCNRQNNKQDQDSTEWMTRAVQQAEKIEKGIFASQRRLHARLAPRLSWTLLDFRDELCRQHVFGAIFSPSHASFHRAPVVPTRLVAFLYADAIAYVCPRLL
jgi:hypothetical protein